jgi:hypothetical protein
MELVRLTLIKMCLNETYDKIRAGEMARRSVSRYQKVGRNLIAVVYNRQIL